MKKIKLWITVLIMLGILLACTGCGTTQLALPGESESQPGSEDSNATLFDISYYDQYGPAEYVYFLKEVFSTLLPLIPHHTEFGTRAYREIFAADLKDISPDLEYDQVHCSDSRESVLYAASMPVFYGLLRETETYLQTKALTYDELAAPYGKTHAIKADDLSAMAQLLLRKPVALSFQSVAGTEYIPEAELFVYDSLEDPFREYRDRGWSLEFEGSDLAISGGGVWGENHLSTFFGPIFWYDPATAILYHPNGEEMGYTHNIEGLRHEAGDTFFWCRNTSRTTDPFYYTVNIQYYGIPTKETPVYYVEVGSIIVGGIEGAIFTLPDGILSTANLVELENTFFDDYYRNPNPEGKVTNYFTSCFYSRPEEMDPSVLPTDDPSQAEEWCLQYLGAMPDTRTNIQPEFSVEQLPYLAFQDGMVNGDIYTLQYYNEVHMTNAILILQKTEDSFLFLSNLPAS